MQETFSWQSKEDLKLQGIHWRPKSSPKAVVCLVHGHGEHCDRYAHVGNYFNQKGIALLSYDLYGHGKSEGKRGHVPSYEAVLNTIAHLIKVARKHYPKLPLFLMGHSMGGNFAINYVLKRNPQINGLILSSPWFRLSFQPRKVDIILAHIMYRLYPSYTQSTKLDATAISRDPKEVKKYEEDPLIHSMISPVLFLGVHKGGIWAIEHADQLSSPLLLVHGTADQLTSHEASMEFVEKAGGGDVRLLNWDGGFHELHYDLDKEKLLQAYVSWIEEKR